jgi:hypothetical protein
VSNFAEQAVNKHCEHRELQEYILVVKKHEKSLQVKKMNIVKCLSALRISDCFIMIFELLEMSNRINNFYITVLSKNFKPKFPCFSAIGVILNIFDRCAKVYLIQIYSKNLENTGYFSSYFLESTII